MLTLIKDKIKGWIAWLIVGIISIPFALFGIGQYLGAPSDVAIAQVNDESIMQSEFNNIFDNKKRNLQEQLGDEYNERIDKSLQQNTLITLIRDKMLDNYAQNLALEVTDNELKNYILSIDDFKDEDGVFSLDKYSTILRLSRYSETEFEELQRKYLIKEQILNDIDNSMLMASERKKLAADLLNQQRKFSYLQLSFDNFLEKIVVKDSEVLDFYEKNKDSFIQDKTAKVEYVLLSNASLINDIKPTDEVLEDFYEEEKDNYLDEEKRQASHILIKDKSLAIKVLKMVKNGDNFVKLAKKYSEDIGSKEQGGDLGEFTRNVMVAEFEKSAFSLNIGDISDLVKSEFGYHIIKLTNIIPENIKTFADVKVELTEQYKEKIASEKIYEISEVMANVAYESSSLADIAKEFNLTLEQTDFFTANDIAKNPVLTTKFINTAFSSVVYQDGEISPVIEDNNKFIVMKLLDSKKSRQKELAEVKKSIISNIKKSEAGKLALAEINKIKAKLDKGDTEGANKLLKIYNLSWVKADWTNRSNAGNSFSSYVFSLNNKISSKFFTTNSQNDVILLHLKGVRVNPDVAKKADNDILNIRNSILRDSITSVIISNQKYKIIR